MIDWFTVIAQIVNFIILIFLLKRFLYGPILRAMDARREKIAAAMREAKAAEVEADRRARELAAEKTEFAERKEQLLADAGKEILQWQEHRIKEIRAEIESRRLTWLERLSQDRQAFLQKAREAMVDQVMRIGEKVLRDLADERLDRQVVQVFLKKVDDANVRLAVGDGSVRVRLGFELGRGAADELRRRLGELVENGRNVVFEIHRELGFGIEILAGDKKVEWNLSDYMEGLEAAILHDLAPEGRGDT